MNGSQIQTSSNDPVKLQKYKKTVQLKDSGRVCFISVIDDDLWPTNA